MFRIPLIGIYVDRDSYLHILLHIHIYVNIRICSAFSGWRASYLTACTYAHKIFLCVCMYVGPKCTVTPKKTPLEEGGRDSFESVKFSAF